jgi:nitrite reductase/ring-hydroxylating ferredoxin subunit
MSSKVIRLSIIGIITLQLFLSACRKKDDGIVPYAYVNVVFYANDPQLVQLNAIGNYIYYGAGYKGMIIYRKSISEFVAYERACTYDAESNCEGVVVQSDQFTLKDSCCGSKFSIYDGSIIQGPATYALVQYRTYYDGTILRITN